MMLTLRCAWLALVVGVSCSVAGTPASSHPGWQLVWHDEFDGTALAAGKWVRETGGDGWGNAELEFYTDRTENARIEGGALTIEARRETFGTRDYTSARLKTQGLGAWRYGRMEARIQIPRGQGLWPAFWMLGDNCASVGWPGCGEIDIMENIGKEPRRVHGTAHGPGYSGAQGVTSMYDLSSGAFADSFRVYAVEWESGAIRWYVDDTLYRTITPQDVPGRWVFDHPFFIILNVAVGGDWPGGPDSTTVFPQTMRVDYVRVYERTAGGGGGGGRGDVVPPRDSVDVWTTHGLENVFRDAEPPPGAPTTIRLAAARGETESAQIVLRARAGCLDSVHVEPSRLAGTSGRRLGAEAVRADWVGYVRLTRNSDSTPVGELARRAPDDFPDPLLEDASVTVCAGSTQPALVRVAIPRETAPGVYTGTLALRAGATPLRTVQLTAEVLPVTLPRIPSLRVTNWFSSRAIAQQHRVEEWSAAHWRLLKAYADDMRAHGQTMFQTDLELIRVTREPNGSYRFDYSLFDRWVRLFLSRGLSDIELMHVGRRTTPWAWTNPFEPAPRPATSSATGDTTDVPLEAFLADLQRHLIARGWVELAVLHVADEPIVENVASWRALSRRVHAAAPRLRRIEAVQAPDFGDDLEIWVAEESYLERSHDRYRARQQAGGMELWLYTSWLPQKTYPNRLIDYPLLKTRLLPWVAIRYDATGFLHWGLNQWPNDLDPNKGLFAPGDDFIVYPGRDGPRSSLRWEAFRDGVEDQALFTLWRRRDPAAALAALREVVPAMTTYPRDPAILLAVRRRALTALSSK